MRSKLKMCYITVCNIFKNMFINTVIVKNKFNDIKCHVPASTRFVHDGVGVVIAKDVQLGKNCVIYPNVLIGGNKGFCYPIIGDRVRIYANACIIGNIIVGNDCVIGAGATITKNVPSYSIVVGYDRIVRNLFYDVEHPERAKGVGLKDV